MKQLFGILLACMMAGPVLAQSGPLRLTITDGVIEPLPFAVPTFQAETAGAEQLAEDISRLVVQDLANTGLFREIPASAFISTPESFGAPLAYADWRAINAQAVIGGAVAVNGDQLAVKFRLYDVFSGEELGGGLQFAGTVQGWRRMAHKVADAAYSRIRINVVDVASVGRRQLTTAEGEMSFSPRFSRDGQRVIYSLTNGGNTDLYITDLNSGEHTRLTSQPSIETAPSFSPDGTQLVFESDRSGSQQLYIMSTSGGEARRISFGEGRYGAPVWSPRGDLIAFTKQNAGRFHIGVMRTDGSEERLLTASPLDEGPSWSPNGRVLMFTRETLGATGTSALWSVDIAGRNLRPVPVQGGASDPTWGPLQP